MILCLVARCMAALVAVMCDASLDKGTCAGKLMR